MGYNYFSCRMGGRVAGSIGTNANSASVEVEVEVEVEAELGNDMILFYCMLIFWSQLNCIDFDTYCFIISKQIGSQFSASWVYFVDVLLLVLSILTFQLSTLFPIS